VSDFSGPQANAQWSPDGSTIYFTSRQDAGPFSDLWKVPAAGGTPTRITHTGTINGLAVSLVSSDIMVLSEGGKEGRTVLARVTPNGKLEPIWDQSNVTGFSWFGFTPKGDSLAINAELPDGVNGSYLISTKTGRGRQVLGKGDQAGDFSRDGRWLAYWTGTARLAIAVMDMKDGSTHQLTKSAENDASYWWTADHDTIVFTRQAQRRRMAVVDLKDFLARR
jgi:Tol biopolymer transport system component